MTLTRTRHTTTSLREVGCDALGSLHVVGTFERIRDTVESWGVMPCSNFLKVLTSWQDLSLDRWYCQRGP